MSRNGGRTMRRSRRRPTDDSQLPASSICRSSWRPGSEPRGSATSTSSSPPLALSLLPSTRPGPHRARRLSPLREGAAPRWPQPRRLFLLCPGPHQERAAAVQGKRLHPDRRDAGLHDSLTWFGGAGLSPPRKCWGSQTHPSAGSVSAIAPKPKNSSRCPCRSEGQRRQYATLLLPHVRT